MADDSLFRKAALDKLASPERLDVLMQVTSPKGWIALLTIAALLVGVVSWSIYGSMPDRIDGQGMLTGEGGLRQIRASGTGRLARLDLAVNAVVAPDQIVGEISGVNLGEAVRSAQAELDARVQAHQTSLQTEQTEIVALDMQKGRALDALERAQSLLTQRELGLKEGYMTQRQVDDARAQVNAASRERDGYDAQIRSIRERAPQRQIQIGVIRKRLEDAQKGETERTEIRSTVSGKVVSVAKQPGDMVSVGDLIAQVESGDPSASTLQIVAFISAQTGQRVVVGHPVQIVVSGVPREEFGFLRGEVKSRSQYPQSPAEIAQVMGDGSISEARYRIEVAPTRDASTPTGYAWSTGTGPETPLSGGTPSSVTIEVERYAPITKVLPVIRQTLGG